MRKQERFRPVQPQQTAGSLADPRVLTLPPDITVAEGIVLIKRNARLAGYYLYVLDREAKLMGVVTMKAVMLADPEDVIDSIMNKEVVSLSTNMSWP